MLYLRFFNLVQQILYIGSDKVSMKKISMVCTEWDSLNDFAIVLFVRDSVCTAGLVSFCIRYIALYLRNADFAVLVLVAPQQLGGS